MQWTVRNIRFHNQESVASLTEAELRKGRELLANRGEQKIRKNQAQAICHSPVDTSRIVGHRPKLPTHQQSLGTFCYKFQTQLCREHVT